MFSIVFPGQGSQKIGMVKEFYEKYDLAKRLFKDADEILNVPITKIIFEGPENKLNSTENTQPAIFLASYCIFETIKKDVLGIYVSINSISFDKLSSGWDLVSHEHRKDSICLASTIYGYLP